MDGVSYHFLGDDEFTRLIDEGEFLEWANVHDHRYGTLRNEVTSRLGDGQSLILELDVHGALSVRDVYEDAVLVFIAPPSMEVLVERLRGRATEDEDELAIRLATAKRELELEGSYDEVIVNDDLDEAVSELMSVIDRYENSKELFQDVSDQARD